MRRVDCGGRNSGVLVYHYFIPFRMLCKVMQLLQVPTHEKRLVDKVLPLLPPHVKLSHLHPTRRYVLSTLVNGGMGHDL